MRDSCGGVRNSPVEEEIDIDVLKPIGERGKIEQPGVTGSVSVDHRTTEVRE